jgi:carboxyl-terminal processing protease
MIFKRAFLITFISVFLLAASFAAGYYIREKQERTITGFPILTAAYELLSEQGLKSFPAPPAMEYGMIRGMLQAYDDPYTIFVAPVQHELESDALQGSFGGIGVQLVTDQNGYVVIYPIPDGPASQAGIQDGDRLLLAGDLHVVSGTPIDDIQAAIRGPIGSKIVIGIGRPPLYDLQELKIKLAEIALPSVTWHPAPEEPRLGIIKINLIANSTPKEIQNAVKDLQSRGVTKFALDLRDNPGGLLTAGVDVARLFLKDGDVIQQQYRGQEVETFRVDHPGPLSDIPLVVMINHGSASASEIIAGALKVHGRAVLIGEPSFGKDTIQLVFDLPDRSSLHITAAHWWIPDLDPPIGGNGLQPDIAVSASDQRPGTDPDVQAAIQSLFESK